MPHYQACFALPHTLSHEKFLLQDRGVALCHKQNLDNSSLPYSQLAEAFSLSDQHLLTSLHQTCLSLLGNLAPNLTPLWVQKTHHHSVLAPDHTRHILLYAQSHLAHATRSALDDQPFFYALSADEQKTPLSCPPDINFALAPWASWSAYATITPDGSCFFQAIHINIHPSFLQAHLDATFFFAQQPQALHQHFYLYEKQVQLQTAPNRKKKAQLPIDPNQKKIFMRIQALRHRTLATQPLSVVPYHEPAVDTSSRLPSLARTGLTPSGDSDQNNALPTLPPRQPLYSTLVATSRTFTNGFSRGLQHAYYSPLWQKCAQFVSRFLQNRISRWLVFFLASSVIILFLRSLCYMVLIRPLLSLDVRFATQLLRVTHFPSYLFRITCQRSVLPLRQLTWLFCACRSISGKNVLLAPKPTLTPTKTSTQCISYPYPSPIFASMPHPCMSSRDSRVIEQRETQLIHCFIDTLIKNP